MRTLVALDVTYAQGYGLARPGAPWPALIEEAVTVGAAGSCRPARVDRRTRRRGAFANGMAGLADELANATAIADLATAIRSAARILRADDVVLTHLDRAANSLVLVAAHNGNPPGTRWRLDDFPATRYVLDHRVPGQIVVATWRATRPSSPSSRPSAWPRC